MAKPRNIIPSRKLCIKAPENEVAKLDLLLFQPEFGRVPTGAYREFLIQAIRDACEYQSLDLAPYCGTPSGVFLVRGSKEAIQLLSNKLKGV